MIWLPAHLLALKLPNIYVSSFGHYPDHPSLSTPPTTHHPTPNSSPSQISLTLVHCSTPSLISTFTSLLCFTHWPILNHSSLHAFLHSPPSIPSSSIPLLPPTTPSLSPSSLTTSSLHAYRPSTPVSLPPLLHHSSHIKFCPKRVQHSYFQRGFHTARRSRKVCYTLAHVQSTNKLSVHLSSEPIWQLWRLIVENNPENTGYSVRFRIPSERECFDRVYCT